MLNSKKNLIRFNKLSFLGFFVFICISLIILVNIKVYPPIIITENISKSPKIFVCIITDNLTVNRALTFNSYFKKKFIASKVLNGPYFSSLPLSYSSQLNIIAINTKYREIYETYPYMRCRPRNLNIIEKMLSAIEYFLENTDDEFFIRMTDDVYVNMEEIPNLMVDILSNGNPLENPLIIGHCLNINGSVFLQGGAGYLFSRKSAEIFYNFFDQLLGVINWYEDWVVYSLINKIIPDISKTSSHWFNAQGTTVPNRINLERGNFTAFNKCPEVRNGQINCVDNIQIYKKSVFFHQFGFYPPPQSWERILELVPNNLGWYQTYLNSIPCYID